MSGRWGRGGAALGFAWLVLACGKVVPDDVGGSGVAGAGGAAVGAPGQLRDYLGNAAFPDSFWRAQSASEANVDPAPLEQAGATAICGGSRICPASSTRSARSVR